jgi:hypothetical protein
VREVDGVLQDVDLVLQRRRDVDRRVGDDQRLLVPGTSITKQWLTRRAVRSPVSR